jgi:hypothetical protein
MQFDGVFHWTNDADAEPPVETSSERDVRRRRWIASAYALFAVLVQ